MSDFQFLSRPNLDPFSKLSVSELQRKHVLRQQSEGAEGDGAAHQSDLQVALLFFFELHDSLRRYLQNRTRVSVWLYENVNTRIEGHITGDLDFIDFCKKCN